MNIKTIAAVAAISIFSTSAFAYSENGEVVAAPVTYQAAQEQVPRGHIGFSENGEVVAAPVVYQAAQKQVPRGHIGFSENGEVIAAS